MKRSGEYLDAKETAYLAKWLTTGLLENIARMSADGVLYGQPNVDRASPHRVPPGWNYFTGILDWRHMSPNEPSSVPGVATVLEGSLTVMIGDSLYTARKGDWLLCAPNVVHREFCLTTRCSYHLLWFTPSRTELAETRYSRLEGFVCRIYRAGLDPEQEMCKDADSILAAPDQPLEALRNKMLHLAVRWLDLITATNNGITVHDHPIVARMQAIVEQSWGKSFSVSRFASQFGVSRSYLSRAFRRSTGQTIRQAVQAMRIERAKQLLANPALSIKEIASNLGFSDPQHFTHAFRRQVGVPPGVFRETPKASGE